MPVLNPDALGVLHYNGFTFPACTTVSPSFVNILSEDGHSYKSTVYTIEASCVVTSQDTYEIFSPTTSTTDLIAQIRMRFAAFNGNFCFANWGFGTIVLNGPVTTPTYIPPDSTAGVRSATTYAVTHIPLSAGPKVELLQCEFVGLGKMIALKVRFTFEIFNSVQAAFWKADNTKAIEMSLSRSWTTNESGYVIRETKGSVRYWVVFSNPTVIQNEYSWVSSNVVPPLPQYQRSQRFDPDPDGRGFKFLITDTPIESPLPFVAPIRTMRIIHSISSGFSSTSKFFNWWMVNFDIDVEVLRDYEKKSTFPLIAQIIGERMQNITGGQFDTENQVWKARLNNKHLLWDVRITDEVTSNRWSMDCTWRCTFDLAKAIELSKILSFPTSNPENNWAQWLTGMFGIQGVSAPRLQLNSIYRPVSAAAAENTPSVIDDRYIYTPTIPYGSIDLGTVPGSNDQRPITPPNTDQVSFFHRQRIESSSNTFNATNGFSSATSTHQPRNGNSGSGGLAPPGTGLPIQSSSSYKVAPTQSRYITHGFAERVGLLPAIPTVVSYLGIPLTEIGESAIELTTYTIAGGVPVYRIGWYLAYAFQNELEPYVNPYAGLILTLSEPQVNESAP